MAVKGVFEVEFLPYLRGSILAEIFEEDEKPSQIIEIEDKWYVDVNWQLEGPLRRFICGTWDVDVYMESIGRGPEFELPDKPYEKIHLQPSTDGKYHVRFTVPAGFIRTVHENWWREQEKLGNIPKHEQDIVYKPVVTVTYKDFMGQPGPIAGFVEMPILQFYHSR